MPGSEPELIRGGGGDFIVIADGECIWHKREMGDEFPDHGAMIDRLKSMA